MKSRGSIPAVVFVLISLAVIAGVVGAVVLADGPSPAASTGAVTDTTSGSDVNVSTMIEHQDGRVLIVLQGPDLDNLSSVNVRGASLNHGFNLSHDKPRATGTVSSSSTIEVVATLPNGEEVVLKTRDLTDT